MRTWPTDSSQPRFSRVDKQAGTIQWELAYSDLQGSALQAHVHLGQHAVNGGVSVFLCTNLGNGPAGTPACPDTSANLNGVIVASSIVGPGGEIRGQIKWHRPQGIRRRAGR